MYVAVSADIHRLSIRRTIGVMDNLAATLSLAGILYQLLPPRDRVSRTVYRDLIINLEALEVDLNASQTSIIANSELARDLGLRLSRRG